LLSSILDLHSHKKDEDKILKKDPLLRRLYNDFFLKRIFLWQENKNIQKLKKNKTKNVVNLLIQKRIFDCEYISEEITEYFKTSLKNFIKVNYPKIKKEWKNSEQPKTMTIKKRTLKI